MVRKRAGGLLGEEARRRDVAAARRSQMGSMEIGALEAKGSRGWALGVAYQGGGCAKGGQMRQDAKGRHPMRPDAEVTLRTHWTWRLQFRTE